MARRTKDEAEKTRNALIDAAEDVFFLRGVSHASLEEVAETAGVTRGALYWHFKDKGELCDAMLQRAILPHEDLLEELVKNPSPDPLADLEHACLHVLNMMDKDKRRRKVCSILLLRCEYVAEMAKVIERSNINFEHMRAMTEKLFIRARELKLLSPIWSPRVAACSMMCLLTGLIQAGIEKRKGFAFRTIGVACIQSFFASLKNR